MKTLASLVVFLLFVTAASAQQPAALSNKDIIEMVSAGIPEAVIIAKIKNSPTSFLTDTAALKELNNLKVPESIVTVMIEKPSPIIPASPIPDAVKPPQAAPFTPYSYLSKEERKRRLKAPVAIQIGASAETVSQLLIRAFQVAGYTLEDRSSGSLYLTRTQKGLGAAVLASMAGGDEARWSTRVTFSETIRGLCDVSVDVWLGVENRFGKTSGDSATDSAKTRGPLEDLLLAVKIEAELPPLPTSK